MKAFEKENSGTRPEKASDLGPKYTDISKEQSAEEPNQNILNLQQVRERLGIQQNRSEGYKISKNHFGFERDRLARQLREARNNGSPEEKTATLKEIQDLYESLPGRTVEEISKDTGSFFVHTLLSEELGNRHNENSNVTWETTSEDDLDILLALQPSISASSVVPGKESKLWSAGIRHEAEGGLILGQGYIGQAHKNDMLTKPLGIKERQSLAKEGLGSKDDLIKVVRREESAESGSQESYNEIVVNEPHAVAYFQRGVQDKKGTIWILDSNSVNATDHVNGINPGTKFRRFLGKKYNQEYTASKQYLDMRVNAYRDKLKAAEERGLPTYVMTQDKRLFKILDVTDDGALKIDEELTPNTVGNLSGLSAEQRKKIGDRLIQEGKQLFNKEEDMLEAQEIIRSLDTTPMKLAA